MANAELSAPLSIWAMLMVSAVLYWHQRRSRQWLSVGFFVIVAFSFLPIFVSDWLHGTAADKQAFTNGINDPHVMATFWACFAAFLMASLLVGITLAAKPGVSPSGYVRPPAVSTRRVHRAIQFGIPLLLLFALSGSKADTSLRAMSGAVELCLTVAYLTIIQALLSGQLRGWLQRSCWAFVATLMLLYAAQGAVAPIMEIALMTLCFTRMTLLRAALITTIGTVMISMLMLLKFVVRFNTDFGNASPLQLFHTTLSSLPAFIQDFSLSDGIAFFYARVQTCSTLIHTIYFEQQAQAFYEHVQSLSVWAVVPRLLAPFKPVFNISNEYGRLLEFIAPTDLTTAVNIPLMPAAYMIGGTTGIFLFSVIFLSVLAFVDSARRSERFPFAPMMAAYLLAETLHLLDTGAYLIGSIPLRIIGLYVAYRFLFHFPLPSYERAGAQIPDQG